jgi:hypothetical protein
VPFSLIFAKSFQTNEWWIKYAVRKQKNSDQNMSDEMDLSIGIH